MRNENKMTIHMAFLNWNMFIMTVLCFNYQAVTLVATDCNLINSSPHGQNDHHFTDDSFKSIFVNGLDKGLVPNRQHTMIWTNARLKHWSIYAALGGEKLTCCCMICRWKCLLIFLCHPLPGRCLKIFNNCLEWYFTQLICHILCEIALAWMSIVSSLDWFRL